MALLLDHHFFLLGMPVTIAIARILLLDQVILVAIECIEDLFQADDLLVVLIKYAPTPREYVQSFAD